MTSRSFVLSRAGVSTALLACALAACGPEKPRALVLVDGSGPAHAPGVAARVKTFEQQSGRAVRVLQVPAEQAVTLAGRGEADVIVVPMDTPLDKLVPLNHASVAGLFKHEDEGLRVLEVNAKEHPTVEAKGAHDLASAMTAP